jgi:cellulose synthase/poly-beta-1,6-N-acetylglucosamine synthase-like glycosyltransferase
MHRRDVSGALISSSGEGIGTEIGFMSDSSISIAMATFNGARYLGEQLSSLSSQTVKPLELVVCDDASTDETAAICSHSQDSRRLR